MKKYFLLYFIILLAGATHAQPPNNTIFYGGSGDGFTSAVNIITPNTIFYGGSGDGFVSQTNAVFSNTIFYGGIGEGYASQANIVTPNMIFLGGIGDGYSAFGNSALPNNIYFGGVGDGWHAIVTALIPLPVTLLSFTATQAGSAHLVSWVTSAEINTHFFEVQRSANGIDFSTVGWQYAKAANGLGASYSFTVHNPWIGNNFYRLKIVDRDGSITYSNICLLKNTGDISIAIYPNPTAEKLYVNIPVMANIKQLKATIQDANGRLIMQTVLETGNSNALPVNHLPAGIYTLQFIINNQPFVYRFLKN